MFALLQDASPKDREEKREKQIPVQFQQGKETKGKAFQWNYLKPIRTPSSIPLSAQIARGPEVL